MAEPIKLKPLPEIPDDIEQLKELYIQYYSECPIQRYAAKFIGRDEDTIVRWRNDDAEFAERVESAKALWVRQRLKRTDASWALERLEKEVFGDPNKVKDIMYTQFQQFMFIFTLKPDELRRFIQAGLARASTGDNNDGSGSVEQDRKDDQGQPVGAVDLPGGTDKGPGNN